MVVAIHVEKQTGSQVWMLHQLWISSSNKQQPTTKIGFRWKSLKAPVTYVRTKGFLQGTVSGSAVLSDLSLAFLLYYIHSYFCQTSNIQPSEHEHQCKSVLFDCLKTCCTCCTTSLYLYTGNACLEAFQKKHSCV